MMNGLPRQNSTDNRGGINIARDMQKEWGGKTKVYVLNLLESRSGF